MMAATDKGLISTLLERAQKGEWVAWSALMDVCEEELGWAMERERRYKSHQKSWCVQSLEDKLVKAGVIGWDDCPSHRVAVAFQAAVAAVDEERVPLMSERRAILRTEQAKLCRKLFAGLGIKGASITTPGYSMARTVEVRLPSRRDFTVDTQAPDYCPADDYWRLREDEARVANDECMRKVRRILARAFPNHDDRGDWQQDYYDHCWSVSDR